MRYTSPQWRPSLAKRRAPFRSVIDVSALASIMLVLLFLFIAPALVNQHPKHIPADLPVGPHAPRKPDALRDDALIVTITRDGSFYLRETRMSLKYLPDAIREALQDRAEKTVYIKADARAKYGDVKVILDHIRSAGVTNITFLTESLNP